MIIQHDLIHLNQQKYVKESLDKCGLLESKNCDTYMVTEKILNVHDVEPLEDAS